GEVRLLTRDTPEPSPLSHEILNARPYTFLDDAPLEERRTQAVYARRATEPASAADLGALDQTAIERVRHEQRPDPRDADELHDALVTAGFLTAEELRPHLGLLSELVRARRATCLAWSRHALWVAAERLPEMQSVHGDLRFNPSIEAPPLRAAHAWS